MRTLSHLLALVPGILFALAVALFVLRELRPRRAIGELLPWIVYAAAYAAIIPPAIIDSFHEPEIEMHRFMAVLSLTTSTSLFLSLLSTKRGWLIAGRLAVAPLYLIFLRTAFHWSIIEEFEPWELFDPRFYWDCLLGSRGVGHGGNIATCFIMHELAAAGLAGRSCAFLGLSSLVGVRYAYYSIEVTGLKFYYVYAALAFLFSAVFLWLSVRSDKQRAQTET